MSDRRAPTLAVTLAQPMVASHDVATNAARHARVVAAAPPGLVVFPELSLTGYELAAEVVAGDDERLTVLVEACGRAGSVALVGAPTRTGGADHLSMLAVDGSGARVAYDKLYLGGDESERFTPGAGPARIEVDGWRLGLAICRDTGVVEHAERTAALGVDGYVAGVCEHAAEAEVVAERARRIAGEHRIPVAVASFAGDTGEGYRPAAGGSGLWAADGAELARAGPEPDRWVTALLRR